MELSEERLSKTEKRYDYRCRACATNISVDATTLAIELNRHPVESKKKRFMTLMGAFAYFTECQLATVEHYTKVRKYTKENYKVDKTPPEHVRQENIAQEMVEICCNVGIQVQGYDRLDLRMKAERLITSDLLVELKSKARAAKKELDDALKRVQKEGKFHVSPRK